MINRIFIVMVSKSATKLRKPVVMHESKQIGCPQQKRVSNNNNNNSNGSHSIRAIEHAPR